jgi:hypothetical protein
MIEEPLPAGLLVVEGREPVTEAGPMEDGG